MKTGMYRGNKIFEPTVTTHSHTHEEAPKKNLAKKKDTKSTTNNKKKDTKSEPK